MRRVWAWMALNFGKHAGIVGVVGLAITLLLGLGITKLEFATGQDSYLNKSDQVYKDSVRYQDLFGGQAMLTLFTMDEGSDVVDLFTPENIARMQRVEDELRGLDGVVSVVSPLTALEFTQNLVSSDTGDVTQSVAARRCSAPSSATPTPPRSPSGSPTPPRRSPATTPSPRTSRASTTPTGCGSCSTTTRTRFVSRCCRSSPTRATPSW